MEAASKVHRRRCARGHHRADHLGASLRLGSALGVGRRPWNGLIYKVLGAAAGGENFEITRGPFDIFIGNCNNMARPIGSRSQAHSTHCHVFRRHGSRMRRACVSDVRPLSCVRAMLPLPRRTCHATTAMCTRTHTHGVPQPAKATCTCQHVSRVGGGFGGRSGAHRWVHSSRAARESNPGPLGRKRHPFGYIKRCVLREAVPLSEQSIMEAHAHRQEGSRTAYNTLPYAR